MNNDTPSQMKCLASALSREVMNVLGSSVIMKGRGPRVTGYFILEVGSYVTQIKCVVVTQGNVKEIKRKSPESSAPD